MTVLTATAWKSNAELIEDVARLGYLDGRVLDTTYGYGIFWKNWQPKDFIGCDLVPPKVGPAGAVADFRNLPFLDDSFDSVVFDPPYKLNGTPTDEVDERYGVHVSASWQDRYQLIIDGLRECRRVTRRFLLLKCMDQVVSGKKRFQTMDFSYLLRGSFPRMELVDRFDMLVTPRPQPPGRRQIHSQGNYSTLLVFEKG